MSYVGRHRPAPGRVPASHYIAVPRRFGPSATDRTWPCRKFTCALAGFVISLAVVAASGGVQVAPVDPPTVQAAFVAPAVMGGCHR
jgi:hypothetical protein